MPAGNTLSPFALLAKVTSLSSGPGQWVRFSSNPHKPLTTSLAEWITLHTEAGSIPLSALQRISESGELHVVEVFLGTQEGSVVFRDASIELAMLQAEDWLSKRATGIDFLTLSFEEDTVPYPAPYGWAADILVDSGAGYRMMITAPNGPQAKALRRFVLEAIKEKQQRAKNQREGIPLTMQQAHLLQEPPTGETC